MNEMLDYRNGRPLNTLHILQGRLDDLPTNGVTNGAQAFATNARKSGEGAGSGTGMAVWFDEASSTWRTGDGSAATD